MQILSALEGQYSWLAEILAILLLALFFNFFAKRLLRRLHQRFEKQKRIWKDSFVLALYAPLSCLAWIAATISVINLIVFKISADTSLHFLHLLLSIAIILSVAWFVMRWKKLLIALTVNKSKKKEIAIDQGRIDVIDKVLTVLVIFLTLMTLLEATDHSMTTLIAFGGIGGLAIAFASQEIIANFFGGLMIYLTHPFSIGDWVNLPERNIEGHVEEIGWYMTCIRSFEKRPIYVPNSTFSRLIVITPSRMSHRQFKVTIGLRYSDLNVVQQVIADLRAMLRIHPGIDNEQKIAAYLEALGPNSLDIVLSAYTVTTDGEEFVMLKQQLLLNCVAVLNRHGAEMACPVTTVEIPDGILLKEKS